MFSLFHLAFSGGRTLHGHSSFGMSYLSAFTLSMSEKMKPRPLHMYILCKILTDVIRSSYLQLSSSE